MKREDVRKIYQDRTSSLSTITRQLVLAGIGVLWVLRTGEKHGDVLFVAALKYCFVLYVLALAFDLLQYAYQSLAWGIFNRIKEKQNVAADATFSAPAIINWAALFFFWGKVIFAVASYVILLIALGKQVLNV